MRLDENHNEYSLATYQPNIIGDVEIYQFRITVGVSAEAAINGVRRPVEGPPHNQPRRTGV
jgi:hypothetical protein